MIGHAKQVKISESTEMKTPMLNLAQIASIQTSFEMIKKERDANTELLQTRNSSR